MQGVKKQLLAMCTEYVNDRIGEIENAMRSAQAAANDETKSSAGDKYETGRAMMHLEKEKLAGQLSEAAKMKKGLDQIDAEKTDQVAGLGSLVCTPQARYYISASIGKLKLEDQMYFAISPASPIGRALWGKREGESFTFSGKNHKIITLI